MGVKAPEDKRFRRAQVRPAAHRRRSRWAAWLRAARVLLVLTALGGGVVVVVNRLAASPVLRVSDFTVTGNDRLSTGEVTGLLEGARGQHILRVDLDAWRAKLLESPWVADASLRRVLPATIEVTIVERQPMAIGREGDRLFLVDTQGAAIDDYGPHHADLDLPVVDGLGRDGRPERAALAARLLRDLAAEPGLSRRLSQVDVSDPHDAVVLLDGDSARLHLGEVRFAERLHAYLELAPALRERVPAIDYVDLRFDSRVFVRPAGGELASREATAGGKVELP